MIIPELNLISDQALTEGRHSKQDGLGFHGYSKVLSSAAIGTQGPFTIGIFGEWGTGKTSLMRMVQSDLNGHEEIVTLWFNAWRFEKEEHPIVPLVATIVRGLELNQSFLQKLKGQGTQLINALRAVAYGFSAKSKFKLPGFASLYAYP